MTAVEVTEKVQDGVMKAVETSQRWTLGALRSTTSAFDGMMPDAPKVPFADKVPSPTETIDMTFSFAGRLLDAQHSFLKGLVGLSTPSAVPVATKKA